MPPLRFVHVGTGGWGRRWSDTFLPHLVGTGRAVPVAAVDANPEHLALAQRGYGVPANRCYTDARRAFAENPADFAVLVVPAPAREGLVDLALEHGCDILCEKPLAGTMSAGLRIAEKVRRAGRKMAVTMSHRFDQDKQTLERLVSGGEFGPPSYIVGRLTYNLRKGYPWPSSRPHDSPESVIYEAAIHHLEIIRGLSGSNGRTVYASGWVPPWSEWGGGATTLFAIEMENGVRALHEVSMANASTMSPWDNEYWRVECRDATLELDHRRLRLLRNEAPQADPEVVELPLDRREVWMNAWLAEMFADWVAGGPPPPTTVDQNLHCLALTMASIESVRTGTVIDVAEFVRSQAAEA